MDRHFILRLHEGMTAGQIKKFLMSVPDDTEVVMYGDDATQRKELRYSICDTGYKELSLGTYDGKEV